jgi:hypothetical protein
MLEKIGLYKFDTIWIKHYYQEVPMNNVNLSIFFELK